MYTVFSAGYVSGSSVIAVPSESVQDSVYPAGVHSGKVKSISASVVAVLTTSSSVPLGSTKVIVASSAVQIAVYVASPVGIVFSDTVFPSESVQEDIEYPSTVQTGNSKLSS